MASPRSGKSRSPKTSTSTPSPSTLTISTDAPRQGDEIFSITMEEASAFASLLKYLSSVNTHIPIEVNSEGIFIHQGAAATTGKRKGGRGAAAKKYNDGGSPVLNVCHISSGEVCQWHCKGLPGPDDTHVIMVDGTKLQRNIASSKTKQPLRLYAREGDNVLRYAITDSDDAAIQLYVDTTNHAEAEYEFSEENRVATTTADALQQYCAMTASMDVGQRIIVTIYEGGLTLTAKTYGLSDSRAKTFGTPDKTKPALDSFTVSLDVWKHLNDKANRISYPKAVVKFYAKRSDSGVGVLRIVLKVASYGELSIYIDGQDE